MRLSIITDRIPTLWSKDGKTPHKWQNSNPSSCLHIFMHQSMRSRPKFCTECVPVCSGHGSVLSSSVVVERSRDVSESKFCVLGWNSPSHAGLSGSSYPSLSVGMGCVLVGGQYRCNDVSVYVSPGTYWRTSDGDFIDSRQSTRNAIDPCPSTELGRARVRPRCPESRKTSTGLSHLKE